MQFEMLKKISPILFVVEFAVVVALAVGFTYWTNPPEQSLQHYFLDRLDVVLAEPNEILAAYPKIKVEDFNNVLANGGKYILQSNRVTFVADRNKRNVEDSSAISEVGATTFLKNLSKRLNISVQNPAEIDQLITTLKLPEPAKVRKTQTIQGKYTCIPPKANTKATESCIEGVQVSSTTYYALDLAPLENPVMLMTGDQIKVEGEVVPVETLSSDRWQNYPVKGILRAASIAKVE